MLLGMSTRRVTIESPDGTKRTTRTVEIPDDEVLVAAAIELRTAGGDSPAAGRYGSCIGAYFPPGQYVTFDMDPFTGEDRGVVSGGVTPARCVFWHGLDRVADTLYEADPPSIYSYRKPATAPEPGLFDAASGGLEEGAPREVTRDEYERNPALRALCLKRRGCRCVACGMSFEEIYGSAAAGFIHVHHLEPLGSVGHAHLVDPVRDLVPVCPNCHAVIHRREPPFTPAEVRAMLRRGDPSP